MFVYARRRLKFIPCLNLCLGQSLSAKLFFFISIMTFFSITWINIENSNRTKKLLVKEALENVANDIRYADVYRSNVRKIEGIKYILLWTPSEFAPFYYLGKGQKEFVKRNCSMVNCYVTSDRNFFDGNLTKFDAVAFNGRNFQNLNFHRLPKQRSSGQIYIYFNLESADNYPACSDIYDNFFNWTATYRLDSDLQFPYIKIHDLAGIEIGPKKDMSWEADMSEMEEFYDSKMVMNKTKAVAWFVSHCKTRSNRELFAKKLQEALIPYNLKLDIYGACGEMQCPKLRTDCDTMLEKDYFFYLASENSLAEDYVTEKILTAVRHNVVPIVYGGADYSRFLPPNSYLDGRKLGVRRLAAKIHLLISSPQLYRKYFLWKYSTYYPDRTACMRNICGVCEALNNKTLVSKGKVYKNFRRWWLPQYRKRCKLQEYND